MTLQEACLYGQRLLKNAQVPDAGLDAWYLLEMVSGCTRSRYYAHPEEKLTGEQEEQYRRALKKRAARIPLQHITGEQEFMGLRFGVNEHVLIPRQDTEILVEEALKVLRPGMRFLDMCTGSGCILLSLLHYRPGTEGVGADVSEEALCVARENRARLGLEAELLCSDLYEKVNGSFDMIISNPPYVRSGEIPSLMEEVRFHEPVQALDGHEDGLYFYRRITEESHSYLKKGGQLYFEIGFDQGDAVFRILKEQGFWHIEIKQDLAGLDRVVHGTRG